MATSSSQHDSIGVFISYSTENESLARKLKDKLQLLDGSKLLDVFIAAELGGQKWREEIHRKLASASVLILAYTNERMKLDWVSYELGRFHASGQGEAVCVMNTHVKNPPDQIAEWQAYRADREGLRRFLVDLLVRGKFTNGQKINPELTSDDRYRTLLEDAIAELEAEFVAFRTREKYYARRITISSPSKGLLPSRLSFASATVSGNEETLSIFGSEEGVSWQTLKERCAPHTSTAWLAEVEHVAELVKEKRMARPLTPFRSKRGTFLPVVSKVVTLDSDDVVPMRVSVIFVEIGNDVRLGLEIFGGFDKMPKKWAAMCSFFDVGRRFRWNVLEPVATSLQYPKPDTPPTQWTADAQRMLAGIADANEQMRELEIDGEAKFFSEFDRDLAERLRDETAGFPDAEERFRGAAESKDKAAAREALKEMQNVNTAFLRAAVEQMSRYVTELERAGAAPAKVAGRTGSPRSPTARAGSGASRRPPRARPSATYRSGREPRAGRNRPASR